MVYNDGDEDEFDNESRYGKQNNIADHVRNKNI